MVSITLSQLTERITRTLASLLALLGIGACLMWIVGVPLATQLLSSSAPMVFNTALLFVVAGLGLLALSYGLRLAAIPGSLIIVVLAASTLVQYLIGTSFGIDELFVKGFATAHLGYPGRMAPNTASAFVVSGTALFVLATGRSVASSAVAAVLGSLTLIMGLVALLGYAFDLETAYAWIRLTRMSTLAASAFVVFGIALMSESAVRSGASVWSRLPWLGMTVGMAASFLSFLLWLALRAEFNMEGIVAAGSHTPNILLALGLCVSVLLAATIAQAQHLKERTLKLVAANRLIESKAEEIEDLYEHAPCGYHSLDGEGRFVRINHTELEWLGYTRDEVVGKLKVTDLMTAASAGVFKAKFPEFKERGYIHDLELELIRKDGTVLPMLLNATAITGSDGSYVSSRSTLFDIREQKRLQRELEHQSQTDVLTGLATRRYFMQSAEYELKRIKRGRGLVSMLMVDLDHFKAVNDRYGHQAGDTVLSETCNIIKRALREVDIAGRLGGEEFAIVLPDTDKARAFDVAERLRQAIASAEFSLQNGVTLRMTVSIGVAECSNADMDLTELIRRADYAMYEAKRSGRNQVHTADSRDCRLDEIHGM